VAAPLLIAKNLSKRFGGLQAVDAVSLEVQHGEILGVIGPNGAGKTTFLNLLSGVYTPDSGSLRLENTDPSSTNLSGIDLTNATPEARAKAGLGRAFQIAQPFPEMTVLENVAVGALFAANLPMNAALKRAEAVLELTGLAPKRHVLAHNLSLLEDKRLEMARALSTNPKVLLLDEVMAGLRPAEALEAVQVVKQIRASGIAVLFIEHLMHVVRELADRVVVMNNGAVLATGSYAQVTQNPAVVEAYLGTT
jgi:branched-chain amino acid transport system ATP-binding protein